MFYGVLFPKLTLVSKVAFHASVRGQVIQLRHKSVHKIELNYLCRYSKLNEWIRVDPGYILILHSRNKQELNINYRNENAERSNQAHLSIAAAKEERPIGREFIEVILKFLVILHVFIIVIIPLDNNKM